MIFKMDGRRARKLGILGFKNEKELQAFIENNLEDIFGVKFLATEFPTGPRHGGRIDTLGLDENGSPVIVEYKWGEKDNVINQGLFYLDWLVDHQGDFEMLVAEKHGKRIPIDWEQPRVILVASAYHRYDVHAINRLSENIELWAYSLHEDGIFSIQRVGRPDDKPDAGPKRGRKEEKSAYGMDFHLAKTSPELKELFLEMRDKLLALPGVEERSSQKTGITFRTSKSLARFEFKKNSIDLLLRGFKYDDPQKLAKDITSFAWGFKGLVKITRESDVDYLFKLLKQSYEESL